MLPFFLLFAFSRPTPIHTIKFTRQFASPLSARDTILKGSMYGKQRLGARYLLGKEIMVIEKSKSEMLERLRAEAEELIIKETITQEIKVFKNVTAPRYYLLRQRR